MLIRLISSLEYSGRYYVLLHFIFILLIFMFGYKKYKPKKNHFLFSLFLAGCFQVNVEPIQENDQYRYFWEGKVVSHLKNPYLISPSDKELNFIDFPERNLIAYNKLTSIYPPLSLAFWASFSAFDYKTMLIINQILFLIIYLIFCSILLKAHQNYFFLALSSMTFLKEFVQAVHIDLLAGLFLLLFFIKLRNNKVLYALNFLSAQILTKLLGILIVPFLLIRNQKKLLLIVLYAMIPSLIYIGLALTNTSNGPSEFIKSWKWNSLIYEILLYLNLDHNTTKLLIRSIYLISYILVLLSFYKKKISFLSSITLVFATLFFFTHVYNAWYGIYLFIPAYLVGNLGFVLYSIAGFLGYLIYDYEIHFTIALMTHLFFFWGCIEMIKNKDKENIKF